MNIRKAMVVEAQMTFEDTIACDGGDGVDGTAEHKLEKRA
jgi:hypothetical protein